MKKGWSTTKLIAVGSLGVLAIILMLFGAGITSVVGISLTGVTNALVIPAVLVFCLFLIPKLWSVILLTLIYGVMSLLLPVTGPPGFFPKIIICVSQGFTAGILFFSLRKHPKLNSLLIGGISQLVAIFGVLWFSHWVNIPGIEHTFKLVSPVTIGGAFIVGAFGGHLGYLLYQKLKNTAVVKRIQRA